MLVSGQRARRSRPRSHRKSRQSGIARRRVCLRHHPAVGTCIDGKGAKVHIIIQDEKDGIRDDRYLSNSDRETCLGQTIPLDQIARLQQRCDAINRLTYKDKEKYKRAIFIHVDSRGHKDQVDVFFYHSPGSKLGKRLTENIHKTFERKYDKHQPNRGFRGTVSERSLYVLKNPTRRQLSWNWATYKTNATGNASSSRPTVRP